MVIDKGHGVAGEGGVLAEETFVEEVVGRPCEVVVPET